MTALWPSACAQGASSPSALCCTTGRPCTHVRRSPVRTRGPAQVVRGAPKNKPNEDDVEGLFERARAAGATAGPAPTPAPAGGTAAFSGAAHTLAGGAVASGAAPPAGPPPPVTHLIAFYANGVFNVDDGAAPPPADRLHCIPERFIVCLSFSALKSVRCMPCWMLEWKPSLNRLHDQR